MLSGGAESGADHAANDDRRLGLAAEHVFELGGLVEDFIEAHAHEIDEHELGDGTHAAGRRADGSADIGRFRQRRVEQPLAIFGIEALGDAEDTTPGILLAVSSHAADDVLAHDDDRRIARHFLVESLVERLPHADLACHCSILPISRRHRRRS